MRPISRNIRTFSFVDRAAPFRNSSRSRAAREYAPPRQRSKRSTTSSVISRYAWCRKASSIGYRRSIDIRCSAWLLSLLPNCASSLSLFGDSEDTSHSGTPSPRRKCSFSIWPRTAVGVLAVAPSRNHPSGVPFSRASRTSSLSKSAVISPVRKGERRRYVSPTALSLAVPTRRSIRVSPGRTTRSARNFSHARPRRNVGLSCSSARSTSHASSDSNSSSSASRYPRYSRISRRWSVRVWLRPAYSGNSLGSTWSWPAT